jgi:Domain of unknown function (DUF222)
MCTSDQVPGSVAGALRMAGAGLDYLNGPAAAELAAPALGEVLVALGELSAKLTAAQAGFLARFDAADAHDDDGYGSSSAWLAARAKLTRTAAGAAVRQMRLLRDHPHLAGALAAGQISESWADEIAGWTKKLPAGLRADTDQILVQAAAGGAELEDLAFLATRAYEQWRSQNPDPDDPDDGFGNRYLQLGVTFSGAARLTAGLTPECAAALQAVLDALGKRHGPEDDRTAAERFHDALQEGCELLIRAKMVPGRAGSDTRVEVHIGLSQLRGMPGASELETAWINARLGQSGYLLGKDAEAAACDALLIPVVTGHADMTVIDQMIEIALTAAADAHGGAVTSKALSPEAWAALRYAMARLAVDFLSGPAGLAAFLRTQLLDAPLNTVSLPLDIGYSDTVPEAIRRAVILRDQHCAWPGCRKPAAVCDVHHIVHKKNGGKTSVSSCVLLCQFHHDVCIHRRGWTFLLHPDGTTEARSPDGQILRSHGPPTLRAG